MTTNGTAKRSSEPAFNEASLRKVFGIETFSEAEAARTQAAAIRELGEIVANVSSMRKEWIDRFLDPRRDLDAECGYPASVTPENLRDLYRRNPIAARINDLFPEESWLVSPQLYSSEKSSVRTEWEAAWDGLGAGLSYEPSYFAQEEGSPILSALEEADKKSGIGSYGVLLLSINDGRPLYEPAAGVYEEGSFPVDPRGEDPYLLPFRSNGEADLRPYSLTRNAAETRGRKLTGLRSFSEDVARITRFENNPLSPRYGLPLTYSLTFNDPKEWGGGVGLATNTVDVHWTRVLHLSDGGCPFAPPRLENPLNSVLDLRKLYGGSAEMYWKGALPGLSFETNPDIGDEARINKTSIREQAELYQNGLQRFLLLTGMTAKSLAPQVVDPTAQVKVILEAICIRLGVPMRIFLGSERGELASSQDERAWAARMRKRRRTYNGPRILIPFVNRLILLGALPAPPEPTLTIYWPDEEVPSELERADVLLKKTQAYAAYEAGVTSVAPKDYMTRFDNKTEEEADAILEAGEEYAAEKEADSAADAIAGELDSLTSAAPVPGVPGVGEGLGGGEDVNALLEPAANEGREVFPEGPVAELVGALGLSDANSIDEWLAENASYFSTCPRDKRGRCLPASSVGPVIPRKERLKREKAAATPKKEAKAPARPKKAKAAGGGPPPTETKEGEEYMKFFGGLALVGDAMATALVKRGLRGKEFSAAAEALDRYQAKAAEAKTRAEAMALLDKFEKELDAPKSGKTKKTAKK